VFRKSLRLPVSLKNVERHRRYQTANTPDGVNDIGKARWRNGAPLKNLHRRSFYPGSQRFMQAIARAHIRLSPQNIRGAVADLHQVEKAEFAFFIIKEQIDIRIIPGLPRGRGAEKIQVPHAKALQHGFMGSQRGDGGFAVHEWILPKICCCAISEMPPTILQNPVNFQQNSKKFPTINRPDGHPFKTSSANLVGQIGD